MISTAPAGKIVAKTASVHIDPTCNAFLHACFRPFGIHIVPVAGDPVATLSRQKFEGCVLRLYDPEAERILHAARSSGSNRPMVIYAIAPPPTAALSSSTPSINAL